MDPIEKQIREAQYQHDLKNPRPEPPSPHGSSDVFAAILKLISFGHRFLYWLSPIAAVVVIAIWVSNKLANEHVDHPENVFPIVLLALYRPAHWLKKKTE